MREEFEKLLSTYVDAVRRADAEQLSHLFAEDGWLISPDSPPIRGRKAIRENYRQSLNDGFEVEITILDFQNPGDTIYALGTFSADDWSGNWLQVLERQNDDSLIIQRLCWNSA